MLSFFSATVLKAQADRLNPCKKETIIFELEALAALLGGTLLLHAAAVCANDRVVQTWPRAVDGQMRGCPLQQTSPTLCPVESLLVSTTIYD